MNLPNGTLAVTNLMSGLDIFNFPPTQILHTYSHQVVQNVRLQIATLYNGKLLVVGSDDGRPRIVNRASGNGFDRALDHGTGIVSTVGVRRRTALNPREMANMSLCLGSPCSNQALPTLFPPHPNPHTESRSGLSRRCFISRGATEVGRGIPFRQYSLYSSQFCAASFKSSLRGSFSPP